MRTLFRLLLPLSLVALQIAPFAAVVPYLGDPPTAPTPEEVARLPRRGVAKHGPTGPFTVNTSSREEVRNFFNTVYAASERFTTGWNGDVATCNPGGTDPAFRDLVALRINYYRAMAGVPAGIVFDPTFNFKDQAAALIMSANNALSHFPPMSWSCYSNDGYAAAGNSNIAIGNAGPDAITAYLEDFGANNAPVGHRRWILYPQTQIMGTGDVPETPGHFSANATWVQDGHYSDPRPAVRDNFVSWPPPGYIPYQVVFARWSFSYPGADFANATVNLSSNGVNVAVTEEPQAPGNIGENTLVWYPTGLNPSQQQSFPWPRPTTDAVFAVDVQNVIISGNMRNFSYTVTVIDPQVTGPDTVIPTISGPDQPAVNQVNTYTFTAVQGASGYQWRRTQRAPYTAIEGAENGLTYFTTNTSAGYNVIVSNPKASGSFAFHLAHPDPPMTQLLTYTRVLLPGTNAQMQFMSRLGYATTDQVARVQISLDAGGSWQDIYVQAGSDGQGETFFNKRTISLSSFANRSVLIRFSYNFTVGSYFNGTDSTAGWFIDDISFTNIEELTNPVITNLTSGTSFTFTPTQLGDYALDVHAQVYNQFYLEWGPIKRVTASASQPPLSLQFAGSPAVSSGQFQIDFDVTNYRTGTVFQLSKASDPAGSWSVDGSAQFQSVTPNTKFRITTSTGGADRTFYRLSAN